MPARFTEEDAARLGLGRRRGGPDNPPPKPPRARSVGEVELEQRLTEAGIEGWHTEYEFHPGRKWRLDFAFPAAMVAVEVDGSVHRIKGRFTGDLDKHNALTIAGWRLLRFSAKHIATGKATETIRAALAAKGAA
jgi:very-short-patch-repair endonuclease